MTIPEIIEHCTGDCTGCEVKKECKEARREITEGRMMQIEKEHKRSKLMSKSKKDLVDQIMRLEHNSNVLYDTIDQQVTISCSLDRRQINGR